MSRSSRETGKRRGTRNRALRLERDRREASPVVPHALQRVAAIAEEILRCRQRVVPGRFDGDAGPGNAMHEIARKIEHEVAGARRYPEERRIGVVLFEEACGKLR